MPFAEVGGLVSGGAEHAPECGERAIEGHRHPRGLVATYVLTPSFAAGVSHHSGPVRITAREQGGPGGRALWCRRERVGEQDPLACKAVHGRSLKIGRARGTERIGALLIRQHDDHVWSSGTALCANAPGRRRDVRRDVVRRRKQSGADRDCNHREEPALHK